MFNAIAKATKSAFSWNSSQYDAVNPKNKRRNSGYDVKSSDRALGTTERRQMIESGRDINRNFAAGAYMIRKHLDYVSTFSFQPRTGDQKLDADLAALFKWWSRPENCDVAGRHSLASMIRLTESHRTIDGDVFLLKLKSGHMQGIESDRVMNEGGTGIVQESPVPKAVRQVHGIHVDNGGKAIAYDVYTKGIYMSYQYDRTVKARNMLHHGYFDGFDQIRGVSPLASAIPTFVDTLEMKEYARLKAKISQLFALSIQRQAAMYEDESCGVTEYDVDFGKGPVMLDLDPGDEANFLESKTPATEFQDFITMSLQIASKALDIPWSFFDESFTNYSGSRIAMLQYVKSAQSKREQNQCLLDKITRWKLAQWQKEGLLPSMPLRQLNWSWIPSGTPWFDVKNEAEADILLIQNGLKTRREVRQERYGDDWSTVIDELAAEQAKMAILSPAQPTQAPQEQPQDEQTQ
jgi:capsid protein